MKKIILNIGSILIVGTLVLFLFLFVSSKHSTFSEQENRYLQELPEFSWNNLWNGSYMAEWTNYITDHFPMREFFLNLNTKRDKWIGKTEINQVYLGTNGYLLESYSEPKNTDKIIQKLNNFCENHPSKMMLVPTSISINQQYAPHYAAVKRQEEILKKYQKSLNCGWIDLSFFQEQNKQTPLYYHLDHHWNSYGAYYGYQAYLGEKARPITDFSVQLLSESFRGTLDSKINDPSYTSDKMVLLDPKVEVKVDYVMSGKQTNTMFEPSYLTKKDKYSYFLDNNHPLITITNEQESGELLIVKDSYANSMIPFLASHFYKIHVIDPRFYTASISDYLREHPEINETLLVYNMNTIDQDLGILTIR